MEIENKAKKDWFASRKWGMFNHFFDYKDASETVRSGFKAYNSINDRINAFDVENYAKIAHEVNAGYVFFTIMQGSQYMCAPNETFNMISGYKTGEACSERDLIADLITALKKYDIPLFLYFTGDGPYKDEKAGKIFNYYDRETEVVNPEFIEKWTAVLKEYALRYGEDVHGWWIDGAFEYLGYLNREEYLKPYRDAIKSGNPNALIAFNNGVIQVDTQNPEYQKYYNGEARPLAQIRILEKLALSGNTAARKAFDRIPGNSCRYTKYEDFTAGEANEFTELPKGQFVDGSQWHILSFLGSHINHNELWGNMGWNCLGSDYSADYMVDYVKKCNAKGGVVSIDTALFDDGHIDWGQYEILKKLGELRK